MSTISIIIPNYNGAALLRKHLPHNLTVFKNAGITDIIVVDDASTDESVAVLRSEFPEVTVVKNPRNLRFARACNAGAKVARGELLMFLNSDMKVVQFESDRITRLFREKDDLFALGLSSLLVAQQFKEEGLTWGKFEGGYIHTYTDHHPDPVDGAAILWACGGACVISADKFWMLDGFCPLLEPFYNEDLDLCYRAWKRGWRCEFSLAAIVHHDHQGTIRSQFHQKQIQRAYLKTRYIFLWKNISDPWWVLHHVVSVVIKILTVQVEDIRAIGGALRVLGGIWGRREVERRLIKRSDKDLLSLWRH